MFGVVLSFIMLRQPFDQMDDFNEIDEIDSDYEECMDFVDELEMNLDVDQKAVASWVSNQVLKCKNEAMMVRGKPGSGKSKILTYLASKYVCGEVLFCSPTGLAASNICDQARTVHSMFGMNLTENFESNCKVLVVDEVSCLRSSLLKQFILLLGKLCQFSQKPVDTCWPFCSFLFVGDYMQLQPVLGVSTMDCDWFNRYFVFDSSKNVELMQQYRLLSRHDRGVLSVWLKQLRDGEHYIDLYEENDALFFHSKTCIRSVSLCYKNNTRFIVNAAHFLYWRQTREHCLNKCSSCWKSLPLVSFSCVWKIIQKLLTLRQKNANCFTMDLFFW